MSTIHISDFKHHKRWFKSWDTKILTFVKFLHRGLKNTCGIYMLTAKLLHQNHSSAHGHLTAEDPCLQILSVM